MEKSRRCRRQMKVNVVKDGEAMVEKKKEALYTM